MSMKPNSISLLSLAIFLGLPLAADAQSFSSGSNGSDGAFEPTANVTFLPSKFSGNQHALNIFNFTSITIPANVTVRISNLNVPGPIYWLASGAVDIEGTIDLSGQTGVAASPNLDGRRRTLDAGSGGYAGGVGGTTGGSSTPNEPVALPGDGPGGGAAGYVGSNCNAVQPGSGGTFSGSLFLVPLVGGSGGGGGLFLGALGSVPFGASGGAGGGGLLIASSSTITVNGTINANGGAGGNSGGSQGTVCYPFNYAFANGYGGGGSGGGIRLAANTITGTGTLEASGGAASTNCKGHCSSNGGGNGTVRLEAFTDNFTGTVVGNQANGSPFGTFVPTTPPPSVTVTSVNTTNITQPPTGSLTTPDVTIDTPSSVTLTVQASYIPVGTIITLNVFSDNNTQQTVQTTKLAGTLQSSTATANVAFPSGYSLNYVKATWTSTN